MQRIAFDQIVSGQRRGPGWALARLGLQAASIPYRLAVAARNFAYNRGWARQMRAAVPVISVGNLTLGGTGKTPCVEYVARLFREQDVRVAILSRGYGGAGGPNDEALVLEENLPDVPHLQGKDRVALASAAVEELECELIVLDDGFQHRRLARDLDLVVVDATNPWGYGYLFPRGTMREPRRNLRRAGAVVVTHCDQVTNSDLSATIATIRRYVSDCPLVRTRHQPTSLRARDGFEEPITRMKGQPVAAFCGIGNPGAFFGTLKNLGAELVATRTYSDHHPYSREDVAGLKQWAEGLTQDAAIVTTQKDAVKLKGVTLAGKSLMWLRIELCPLDGGEKEALDRKLLAMVPSGIGL